MLTSTACGLSVPADPHGTLGSVSDEKIRIGVAIDPPVAELGPSGPMGPAVKLAEEFAQSINSTPVWFVQTEETLVTQLEAGKIDLAVGGFTENTPWSDRVGITRGYEIQGPSTDPLVMFVPLGENAFLTELEGFLDAEVTS